MLLQQSTYLLLVGCLQLCYFFTIALHEYELLFLVSFLELREGSCLGCSFLLIFLSVFLSDLFFELLFTRL